MLPPAMNTSLGLVNARFERVRDRATRLFDRDLEFRDLCDEYEACAETLARLSTRGPAWEAMRREYAALLLRVERELLRHMEEHPERDEIKGGVA
jgi:hypothetical protein